MSSVVTAQSLPSSHTLDQVLADLASLVRFDSRNPPRDAVAVGALLDFAEGALSAAGFRCARTDLGDGCMWLDAARGDSARVPIVNVHMDTVPVAPGWHSDPHVLDVTDDRAIGLGACDTKGAFAAYLHAARTTDAPARIVLTTDEEAGTSRCVRTFVTAHDVKDALVVVAEPTRMQAVLAHRGIATCHGVFRGVAGHASQARAFTDSAVHESVRWATRALDYAGHHDVRFNLGQLAGGHKANMIASETDVRFGVRPAPGLDSSCVRTALCALAPDAARVTWTDGYTAPPLIDGARADAVALGLTVSSPVDFFTEAALFAAAGARSFVVGPGDIAHAHAPGEFVLLEELRVAVEFYRRLIG